jgi:hypothetical protein
MELTVSKTVEAAKIIFAAVARNALVNALERQWLDFGLRLKRYP